jgi:hypothetical protein
MVPDELGTHLEAAIVRAVIAVLATRSKVEKRYYFSSLRLPQSPIRRTVEYTTSFSS